MTQRKLIMEALAHERGHRSAFSLSLTTGFPEPSIRRAISELRQQGMIIETHPWLGYKLKGSVKSLASMVNNR